MALYRILRGPAFGNTIHLPQSQEIDLQVKLGDLELVIPQASMGSADEAVNQSRSGLPTPQAGWSIVRHTGAQGEVSYVICEALATGEKIYYKAAPPKRRVLKFNPETEEEHYEFVDSGCPPELIKQWETLCRESGTNANHEYAGWLKDQAKNKLQMQIDEQRLKTGGFVIKG